MMEFTENGFALGAIELAMLLLFLYVLIKTRK